MGGEEVTGDEVGEDESEGGGLLVSQSMMRNMKALGGGDGSNSLFRCASRWHMLRAFVRFSSAWRGPREG